MIDRLLDEKEEDRKRWDQLNLELELMEKQLTRDDRSNTGVVYMIIVICSNTFT